MLLWAWDSPFLTNKPTSKSLLSKLSTIADRAYIILVPCAWNFLFSANSLTGRSLKGKWLMYSGCLSKNLKTNTIPQEWLLRSRFYKIFSYMSKSFTPWVFVSFLTSCHVEVIRYFSLDVSPVTGSGSSVLPLYPKKLYKVPMV